MKNDIDSLLDSMFRGGKFQFKSPAEKAGKKQGASAAPGSPAEGSGRGPAAPGSPAEGSGRGPAVQGSPAGGSGRGPAVPGSPAEGSGHGPAVPGEPAAGQGAGTRSEPPPPFAAPVPDPFAESVRAQQALHAVEQAGDSLSESLQQSIERLTQEARADMADLEQHLRQDGVDRDATAGNAGNPQDLDAAFAAARQETAQAVLGQDAFVAALTIAFKRPFVTGSAPDAPLCRAAVLGKTGTGRHSAVETMTAALARRGVLKSPKVHVIGLERYGAPGAEKLFVQDLYAALKSGASALVFEHFEKCHTSVLSMVSALFREGSVPLPGRYAEQKGMLVDIGTALVPGAVSALSGAGKYLFLLTDRPDTKLADAFGAPFLAALDDLCETEPFTRESLLAIARRALEELCGRAQKKLGVSLSYTDEEVETLAGAYREDQGAAALFGQTDALYRALGECKLKHEEKVLNGTVSTKDGSLYLSGKTESGAFSAGLLRSTASQDAVEAVKRELSEIVGLSTVKEYILSLEDNFLIQQMRREKGLKADSPSMHMIFTGNPGTGKTTVARVVSRYLKAIGVLEGGQLVEVTRADLVGKYVGHTAPLTQKAIQSALGGVLFIDEAYSLYRGKDDSFGLEAIDTLVKGMEDHRDSLVVILAGYSREMEEFLTANSGLKSRFPNIIEFPDYTAQELLAITESIVKGKGYRLDPACGAPLLAYFERMQQEGDPRTNGNGRMARNKVEEAVIACSRRNVKEPEETRDLERLLPVDFGFPPEELSEGAAEKAACPATEKGSAQAAEGRPDPAAVPAPETPEEPTE